MNQLPKDLLDLIWKYIDNYQIFLPRLISKSLAKVYKDVNSNIVKLPLKYFLYNEVLIEWAINNKCPKKSIILEFIALLGNESLADIAINNKYPWSNTVIYNAVRYQNINFIKFANNRGKYFDANEGAVIAAKYGHLDMLIYSHQNGANMEIIAGYAAAYGSLDCLQYAHQNGCDMTFTASNAAMYNNLDCLKYAHQNGADMEYAAGCAALYGHLDCFKYAHQTGCNLYYIIDPILESGNLDCLKYCIENNVILVTKNDYDTAVIKGHLDCAEYIMQYI